MQTCEDVWKEMHEHVMAMGLDDDVVLPAILEATTTPLSTDELDMPLHLMLWCRILKTRKHVMDQIQAQPPALDTLQTFFEMCMQGDVHQCQIVLEEIHQYCKSRIQFKRNLCSLPCEKPTFFGAIGPPTT